MSNFKSGSSYNTNSSIYTFDPSLSQFVAFQQIDTNCAYGLESFSIGNTTYLAVANAFDGVTSNTTSPIYRFDPSLSQFVVFQQIVTDGAFNWEYFTIGNNSFLAVANYYNVASFNISSVVYRLNALQACWE